MIKSGNQKSFYIKLGLNDQITIKSGQHVSKHNLVKNSNFGDSRSIQIIESAQWSNKGQTVKSDRLIQKHAINIKLTYIIQTAWTSCF